MPSQSEKTRVCDRCGVKKPMTEYFERKRSRGGYLNICKECERERVRKYFKRYSESYFRARYHSMLARAESYGVPSDMTYDDFLSVIVADDPKTKECVYCGKTEQQEIEELGRSLALDHVFPLHLSANTSWNLVNCCARCNSLKRYKHILEFYRENDFFTEERLFLVVNEMAERADWDFVAFFGLLEALETGLENMKENHATLKRLRAQTVVA